MSMNCTRGPQTRYCDATTRVQQNFKMAVMSNVSSSRGCHDERFSKLKDGSWTLHTGVSVLCNEDAKDADGFLQS